VKHSIFRIQGTFVTAELTCLSRKPGIIFIGYEELAFSCLKFISLSFMRTV